MKIKDSIKYYVLGKSLKEIQMDKILQKISKKSKLTDKEKRFLDLYNHTSDKENKDYMMVSKNTVFKKIKYLLSEGKTVICNLTDRDGKIGQPITDISNNFESDSCQIIMKGDIKHNLYDRYLYNIIYNIKKDRYSLEEHDEYYEKIEAKNDFK